MNDSIGNYSDWWNGQFPCECGHPPGDHFLAPEDGKCRACVKCHGAWGGMMRYSLAIVAAAHPDGPNL